MKLSELKADSVGRVLSLGTDTHYLKRITSIGLTEGSLFQIVRNDRKMPVLVYVRETLLALNRADADKIEAEDLGELLVLRDISKALMRRIDGDYRLIITLNSMLILLGAFGIITPAASATLHNLSTIGISVYNMTDLIGA